MIDKRYKGQVFFKYLWQNQDYRTGGGVSPSLANDILDTAKKLGGVDEAKTLDNKQVFHWIAGSVIPKWARLAGFALAVQKKWQPVDVDDVLTVFFIENTEPERAKVYSIAQSLESRFQLRCPKPILDKIIKDKLV